MVSRQPQMVQAAQFDPTQGPATYYDPVERLKQLRQEFEQYPGAAPGGSGPTGLMSQDARGYSQLLQRQQEAMQLNQHLQGKDPMQTRVRPGSTGMPMPIGGYAQGMEVQQPNAQPLDPRQSAVKSAALGGLRDLYRA